MTPSLPDGAPPAPPRDLPHVGPVVLPDALPHAHAALRAERIRVTHWRRLVRARMDLAAAAVALPEALGHDVVDVLPGGLPGDLPQHLGLLDAVSAGGPAGEIDRLEALRALDERLARYELTVTRALHRAVSATREPGAHRPGPGAMGQTVAGRT